LFERVLKIIEKIETKRDKMKAQKNKVILASASPRRKEILGKTGIDFEVQVSDCDENIDENRPDELVMKLSELKAKAVAAKNPDAIIIGSDTVVAHKGQIMGKPADRAEAISMIKSFAGDIHQVYTGVTIIIPYEKTYTYNVCTDVHVLPMTDEEIERYVDTGEPMDKAGAYAIQGLFAPFISKIDGDYYNVVGLPISSVYAILKNFI
jgi:septum formation protein